MVDLLEDEGWRNSKEQYGFYVLLHVAKSTMQCNKSRVCYDGSEQHKEVSNSRTNKDYEELVMVMQYILPRSPFCPMKELLNIHTGEVADRNDDEVYKIGLKN